MENYKVYLIRDKQKNIVYAGLTKNSLRVRFEGHVQRRHLDRNEYSIELVQEYLTLEQAVILEDLMIQQYSLLSKGWNKSPRSINGYSNTHSEEQKEKWSKERKGIRVSPQHAAKNRIARLGKTNSPEHQGILLKALKKPVMCVETGEVFDSARSAGKALGVSYCRISECCNGKRVSSRGLHFIFIPKQ